MDFIQMLPWLIIACLLGIVIGLIVGMHISSSLFQRHHQAVQPPPPVVYQRGPTRYADDDHYSKRR